MIDTTGRVKKDDLMNMGFFSDLLRYRGRRVIICPETQDGAVVTLKALQAATSGQLKLSSCTRWPERAGCDQACLTQIAQSPEGCRIKALVAAWYDGKRCVCCHRPFLRMAWQDGPPALLRDDGRSCEWKDLKPEDLPRAFRTSQPLCWYCNNIRELEHIDPKLIVRRTRPAEPPPPPLNTTNLY
jgi:hypothetical protein